MVSMRTYAGGPNLKGLQEAIKAQAAFKKHQAVLALAVAVDQGTLKLQDALEAAVTKTGLARELRASGGFPGRHRTGEMVASISNNSTNPEYSGDITLMALGWFAGEFQEYFKEQDLGPEAGMPGIPPARAMFQAQQEAMAVMNSLMQQWENGTLHFND